MRAITSPWRQSRTAPIPCPRSRSLTSIEDIQNAGQGAKGPYSGPGWAEWILCLILTAMIGLEFLTFRNSSTAHSALRYYFELGWVRPLHYAAILLNTTVIVLTGIGIFLTRRRVRVEPILSLLAMAGFFLAWGEIFAALQVKSTLFRLTQLPYQPVNNTGLLGAQAFAMYIIFKLPSGHLEAWKGFLIRLGLAIGAFLAQLLAFQLLSGSA